MKVVIIGAGGVRTPQLANALLNSKDIPIKELALFDIDQFRLESMNRVFLEQIQKQTDKKEVGIYHTIDIQKAVCNADFILFTIRVGQISARIKDEQVPLRYGVVGQETTGPGGFAMAMRTIPVMYNYLDVIKKHAPKAWVLNLTNPAGLITQALIDRGYDKVVGICDSPSGLTKDIANAVGVNEDELWFEYFGLNHLGWIKSIIHRGEDIFEDVINNDQALKRHGQIVMEPEFIRTIGIIPNEYLLFYYLNQAVIKNVKDNGLSRAQLIELLNHRLFSELQNEKNKGKYSSLEIYKRYIEARHGSYMKLETKDLNPADIVEQLWNKASSSDVEVEDEGYSAIALAVLEAISGGKPKILRLNVRNDGAISFLKDEDVVEISVYVDRNGVHPFSLKGEIAEHCRGLLQVVKSYERLTIKAVKENSYSAALLALIAHPLVPDAKIAKLILDDFIIEHGDYFPQLN